MQKDVDAAVENPVEADVFFVCTDRRVGRNELDIVPQLDQGGRQRIIAEAIAADHTPSSSGNVGDFHGGFSLQVQSRRLPGGQLLASNREQSRARKGAVQSGSGRNPSGKPRIPATLDRTLAGAALFATRSRVSKLSVARSPPAAVQSAAAGATSKR